MKTQIQELLQKDMSRHEFLVTLGIGIVSILGFSSILKFLLEGNGNKHPSQDHGYGSSAYGP